MEKNLPVNEENPGDVGLFPGSERSPGGGNGNPLQYFFFFLISVFINLFRLISWLPLLNLTTCT